MNDSAGAVPGLRGSAFFSPRISV